MEPRIIKTHDQYLEYLSEVEKLAMHDPDSESPEGIRLELLAKLAEDYEKARFIFDKPDAVDAILFRMEEKGLKQKDIAELLGGKNRASEVLSRKRPLTLQMIRALHDGLHIPLEILVREAAERTMPDTELKENDLPLDLMKDRGWIEAGATASDIIKRFLAPSVSPVLFKHTIVFGKSNTRTNSTRIQLWVARVREIAASRSYLNGRFDKSCLNENTLSYIARLSWMDKGPRLAMEFLAERGIALVIEPHLPPTRLDGAAMMGQNGAPVIGLTLRENRLDNFWFTLMHELVHAWRHLNSTDSRAIVDENIEKQDPKADPIEKEANTLAAEIFVPRAEWLRSKAHLSPSAQTIYAFAMQKQISPAIVAGRIRYERQNYTLFSKLVGYREPRAIFPDVKWGA